MPTLYSVGRAETSPNGLNIVEPGAVSSIDIETVNGFLDKILYVCCDSHDIATEVYAVPRTLIEDVSDPYGADLLTREHMIGRAVSGESKTFQLVTQKDNDELGPLELDVTHTNVGWSDTKVDLD